MLKYMRPGMAFRPKLHRARRQHLRAGNEARDRKSWGEAAQAYQRYLAEVPADAPIWTQLGHALKESGDLSGGEAAYRTGLAFAPQDAELHLQLGHVLKLQGRLAEAERAYVRASELDSAVGAQAEMGWHGHQASPAPLGVMAAPNPASVAPFSPEAAVQDAATCRRRGDLARDQRNWQDAALHYRSYLALVSDDAAIWVQYGHAVKEGGDLPHAEAAYRSAVALKPMDADAHLQLGQALKRQDRHQEAVQAYRQSLSIAPTRPAVTELRSSGYRVELEDIPAASAAPACLYLEVTDLITTMRQHAVLSSILRVQLALLNHALSRVEGARCEVAYWADGLLWSVEAAALREAVRLYGTEIGATQRRALVDRALEYARPVCPGALDTFVVTGAVWTRRTAAADHAWIKGTGARLGAYIYDLMPLTHPEYYKPSVTERFANTMAELMAQLDFALVTSDLVGAVLQRLRREGGYPPIPVQTVKLADALNPVRDQSGAASGSGAWTGPLAGLRGKAFVLCVGSLAAHKNHIYALNVWRLLLERGIEPPVLVFVGKRGYGVEDLMLQLETTRNLGGRVRIIEGLDDEALAALYDACLFTLFPSFAEGWGLPVGESLARGKLCVASTATSLPEVGPGLTCGIDPYNVRGGADTVAALLLDPAELRRQEGHIRAVFQPRTWADFSAAFLAAASGGEAASRAAPLLLEPMAMLQPQPLPVSWDHGTSFPPAAVNKLHVIARTAFRSGWSSGDDGERWMGSSNAAISFTCDCPVGAAVRVIMQFRSSLPSRRGRLHVTAASAGTASVGMATATIPSGPCDFLVALDTTVAKHHRLDLILAASGVDGSGGAREQAIGVGLRKIFFIELDDISECFGPGAPARPRALTGLSGAAATPHGRDALIEAARRQSMLAHGWLAPEAWGAWMDGRTAGLKLRSTAQEGEEVRVALRLRSSALRAGMVVLTSLGGAETSVAVHPGEVQDVFASVTGRVGRHGVITVQLAVRPSGVRVGLSAAAWGRLHSNDDRVAMMEAVLYGLGSQPADDHELLGRDIGFTVAGHLKGSYSLAAVNRRLALALDAAVPGRTRVLQVEGQPLAKLEGLAGLEGLAQTEQARLQALAAAPAGAGPDVIISQHWPVWVPPRGGDLKLAYVFWEESIVPRTMVRTLNEGFDGVLVPARSVAKALLDSGVRVPVRCIGFAPDLSAFQDIAKLRAAHPAGERRPFTFLHISSCFPRKGVDVLIAAYAKAFTSRDPVRLVIKGFPNPHNDVAGQLALLRTAHADLAAIEHIDADLSEDALLELYRAADTVVLPTRGEGFNIPAAEAMAAGIPLIVTAFGAHADFTEGGLARWVDYRFTYSRSHLRASDSVWAEPDVDDLAAALQDAVRQNAGAGRTPSPVVLQAQQRAAVLGDGALWAQRVRAATAELLAMPAATRPKIAWVTTWKLRCGIAEYSRLLLAGMQDAARDVTVLCDARTADEDLNGAGPAAEKAWQHLDSPSMAGLAAAIDRLNADAVMIQHHPGLIGWNELAALLADDRLRARHVVVTMHNTREFRHASLATQERLAVLLRSVDRVLVHTVDDLNLLKRLGLVENVTRLPHGTTTGQMPVRAARLLLPNSDVLLGTYGFFLPHKGFHHLIEAFALVRKTYARARLRLVTAEYPAPESAVEIARCKALADALGIASSIEWHLQYLENSRSFELLHDCDLLILPYQHTEESSSAAVRSALAAGVPTLVTPLPIFEEMQDAVLRMQGTDVFAIHTGIEWVLQRQGLREQLAAHTAAFMEENNWASVAERLCGLLQGLTSAGDEGLGAGFHGS